MSIKFKRGKVTSKTLVGINHYWEKYSKTNGSLSEKEFKTILKDMGKSFGELLITGGNIYLSKLGVLTIEGYKPKLRITEKGVSGAYINWGATLKYWKEKYPELSAEEVKNIPNKLLIYYDNSHSERITYAVKWRSACHYIKGKMFYRFSLVRELKRDMAIKIKTNGLTYRGRNIFQEKSIPENPYNLS